MQTLRVLLINISAPTYNLGLEKARLWWITQGAQVDTAAILPSLFLQTYDVVWISAIFSWHVPKLIATAQVALDSKCHVEVGGPGTFGVRDLISRETGLSPQATPDPRFERQPGQYSQVFWSRGCPAKNCSLGFPKNGGDAICLVPAMEGWRYTLYGDAEPAPIILDNNLSALPRSHQEHIVERTLDAGFPAVDASSGNDVAAAGKSIWFSSVAANDPSHIAGQQRQPQISNPPSASPAAGHSGTA